MLCYKDKTFCNKGDKNSEKCRQCDRYFDEEEYKKFCEARAFKLPISFYYGKPCEKRSEKGKDNE